MPLRSNGHWQETVRVDADRRISRTFPTQEEAIQWAETHRSARRKRRAAEESSLTQNQKRQRGISRSGDNNKIESQACKLLLPLLSDAFDVEQVRDGAHCDLAVRRVGVAEDDAWYGLQIKSTAGRGRSGRATFSHVNKYPHAVVVCVNLSQSSANSAEIWLFHGRDLVRPTGHNLDIGRVSKYDAHKVSAADICTRLSTMLLSGYKTRALAWLDTEQLSINTYLEHRAHVLWKAAVHVCIPRLPVGSEQNRVFDVLHDGDRIQEKVCRAHRGGAGFRVDLRKSRGCGKKRAYDACDWDALHVFLLAKKRDDGGWDFSREGWNVGAYDPSYGPTRDRVDALELLGYWDIPMARLGDYVGVSGQTAFLTYLPEAFGGEIGHPAPTRACKNAWTRAYFHAAI